MNLYLQQKSFLETSAGFKTSSLAIYKVPKTHSFRVYNLLPLRPIANDFFHVLDATEGIAIPFLSRLQRATLLEDASSIAIIITDGILHSQIPQGHDGSTGINVFNIDPISSCF